MCEHKKMKLCHKWHIVENVMEIHMVCHPRCVFINYNWIKLTVEQNYLVVRYMLFIT